MQDSIRVSYKCLYASGSRTIYAEDVLSNYRNLHRKAVDLLDINFSRVARDRHALSHQGWMHAAHKKPRAVLKSNAPREAIACSWILSRNKGDVKSFIGNPYYSREFKLEVLSNNSHLPNSYILPAIRQLADGQCEIACAEDTAGEAANTNNNAFRRKLRDASRSAFIDEYASEAILQKSDLELLNNLYLNPYAPDGIRIMALRKFISINGKWSLIKGSLVLKNLST